MTPPTPPKTVDDKWPKNRIEFLRSLSEPWRYLSEEDVTMLCNVALEGLTSQARVKALEIEIIEMRERNFK